MTDNDTFGKWPGTETDAELAAALEKDSPAYIQGWNDCHAHMAKEIVRLDDRIAELEAAASIPPTVTIHALGHDSSNLYGISPEDWSRCTVHTAAQRKRIMELMIENESLSAAADEHINAAHRYRDALEAIAWSNDSEWQAQCAKEALNGRPHDHL